jgi:hypothetical protein
MLLCGATVFAQDVDHSSQTEQEGNPVQPPPALQRINELLALGVPELALSFVERAQPELNEDNVQYWLLLEQQRYRLFRQLEMWQGLIERGAMHQPLYEKYLITYADRNWFTSQQIRAHLQLKHYRVALTRLQQNLWREKNQLDTDVVALWRRLVIRSYLNLNQVDDAQRAMRRYRQDYGSLAGDDGIEWPLLQAQLLLRSGSALEAVQLLQPIEQAEARALLLLARLQAKQLSVQSADQQLQALLDDSQLDARQQSVYWYARLQLAVAARDYQGRVTALEKLFALDNTDYLFAVFTDAEQYLSIDRLWEAYQQYGIHLANGFRLLRGDDVAWYSKASNLFESQPQQARALLAVLAFNARQPEHRSLAMQHITGLLEKHGHGLELVNQLFMHSDRISDMAQVPAEVRYRLVDYALQKADLQSAARLMEDLAKPPEGQDLFDWSLRRARILILGGEYQDGAEILLASLEGEAQPETKQIDQYMQVVFDLQNVQQHRYALSAFEKLERVELTPKLRREIAYWKAESFQQLKDYEQAAFLFLKSAIPLDDKIDPWFHTASFKAAEALAQAGLVADARRQYLRLLRLTLNSARQAVIRQRLQQLRLQQNNELSVNTGQ